jgi:O-antigen ligase
MAKKRTKAKKQSALSVPLDRVLFYGVLFLVFALPLFLWPGISEYGYGKTIVALIGTSVLAVLWGLSAWQKGTWTIRLPWITVPVLGLVAASLLSTLHATNGRVVVQSLVLVVFFTLLMIIIANAVRDQRDVSLLLLALLASAFLAALYGLLQYLGIMRGPTGTSGLDAIISTMGNRNYLGGFLTYLLFPAVVLVVRPRWRWARVVSILLIAFCFGMILILRQTGTSVALVLSTVAFLIGWVIFRPIEPIRRNRLWLLVLVGALIVTFLIEAPSGPLNSVVGLSADERQLPSGNLLLSPGFEEGATLWGWNGQLQPAGGHGSQAWWKIERAGKNVGDWQLGSDGQQGYIPIDPGTSFEFGGAILSDGRTIVSIRAHLYDAQKKWLTSFTAGRKSPESWRQVETVFTAPRTARYASIQLTAYDANGWAGFDNLFLRPVGRLEAWFRQLWERNSGAVRSWDWWVGWEMFADHPLTGVGLGNYKLGFLPYKAEFLATPRGEAYEFYIDRAAQAHNEYVQILAELGVLGVLALASFLAVLTVTLWKRLRSNDEANRLDLLFFTCGIAAFLIHGLVSFPAHLPASSLVLILVGGLAFSRVYGESGQFSVNLTGWRLKGALVGVVLIGLVVSVVAGRDLSANLLMSKGIEQAQLGNNYGAESLLERSLELDFAPRQTYNHLAMVQIERGAYEEAQANLERCFTRFVDETVYLNYANLTANSRQFDLAREAITLLLAGHPREEVAVRARYLEAVIIAQSGDPREATALLEQLISDAPWFETSYIGLGSVYAARGMPVNARQAFEEALRRIDQKLEEAQEALASQATITAEEYGRLRTEIEQLRQQRETVLETLEGLSPAPSP